ncbi:deoxynucleoside monophosphate kinase [Pseudomonas phage Waldo5]|uniref:Deoxynucleoside monophosphate kinase n=1 Tax=Pseudomonas phage Waldo5 TaxID=2762290 RepID=A0A7G8LJM8_9CAUD|nr:deoxynucleoside monophosphate kinase [Pseudomonas phage Waldo5]
MTDKVIIALTSERGRSGKDTLVELLREEGFEVYRVAFGDVLKHACSIVLTGSREAQIVMESHMHTDLKDAKFDELSIENLPESGYKDWLWDVQGEAEDLDVCAPRSPRWHLQQYGTGFRRNYKGKPDVWLNEGLKVIDKADGLVIVTDMRQANEYAALELRGAHLVRLSRDWSIEAVDTAPLHATDIELRDHRMDAVVVNRWGHASDMLDQLKAQGVIE